jgi:exodeoxyribonuclease VII small subunit
MSEKNNENTKNLREMMAEFEAIVREFNDPDFDVETATEEFARASKLAEEIREKLNDQEEKIEIIKRDFASTLGEVDEE